jgi:hypothetical protein
MTSRTLLLVRTITDRRLGAPDYQVQLSQYGTHITHSGAKPIPAREGLTGPADPVVALG